MSKTQIGGNRVRKGSLSYDHFKDGTKIPESMLGVSYATHPHNNKAALDVITYTGKTANVDLYAFEKIMVEVAGARKDGDSLGSTIDKKAEITFVQEVIDEITAAKGTHSTLSESLVASNTYLEGLINGILDELRIAKEEIARLSALHPQTP